MKFRKKTAVFSLLLLVACVSGWMFDTTVRYGNVNVTQNLRAGSGGVVGFTSTADPRQNALDTGISRCGVSIICIGNGTQGDITGTLKTATLSLPTTSNTLPASIVNDTAGGVRIINNAGIGWQFGSGSNTFLPSGFLSFAGATSGNTTIAAASIASGTLTLPAATDTLVGKATTDTLTNKTLTSPTVVSPIFNTGISQGSGFKHQRFSGLCTTGAGANATCSSVLTWSSSFADANYTYICMGENNTGNIATLIGTAHVAATVTITIFNSGAGGASSFTNANCMAIHD